MIASRYLQHALLGAALLSIALPTLADDGVADAPFGNQGRAIHAWPLATIQSETNAVATGSDGTIHNWETERGN